MAFENYSITALNSRKKPVVAHFHPFVCGQIVFLAITHKMFHKRIKLYAQIYINEVMYR